MGAAIASGPARSVARRAGRAEPRFAFLWLPDVAIAALSTTVGRLRVAVETCAKRVFPRQIVAKAAGRVVSVSDIRLKTGRATCPCPAGCPIAYRFKPETGHGSAVFPR